MKKILAIFITTFILLSPFYSFADADNKTQVLTYDEVLKNVMDSQDEIKLYDEMVLSLKKDVKEMNPLWDDKNYEYIDGQEVETPSSDFISYDYDKLLKDKEYALKVIKNDIELTTLDHYINLIISSDTINEKQLKLELDKKDLEVSQKKYDIGMTLKFDLDFAKKNYDIAKTELSNIKNDRLLVKQRLNKQMGKDLSNEFEVTSDTLFSNIELDGKTVTIPKDALEFAMKNKKSLTDLSKDVKEYKDDLKRFEQYYYTGSTYYKDKEKVFEDLIKDTEDAQLQQTYAFEKAYLNILDNINSMESIDLQINQKSQEIKKTELLFKNGQISYIEYNKKANEIISLKNSKFQKILDIKRTILNYNMSLDS